MEEMESSIKAEGIGLESVESKRVFIFKTKAYWSCTFQQMRKMEWAKLVPGLGDMPAVAWATESARAAFVPLLQEGCIWSGSPSHFSRSHRIPTSCPARTLEQPRKLSPAILWHTAWHDWKDVHHKSHFWLASLGALLFSTNVSYKKPFETGKLFFFKSYVSEH